MPKIFEQPDLDKIGLDLSWMAQALRSPEIREKMNKIIDEKDLENVLDSLDKATDIIGGASMGVCGQKMDALINCLYENDPTFRRLYGGK